MWFSRKKDKEVVVAPVPYTPTPEELTGWATQLAGHRKALAELRNMSASAYVAETRLHKGNSYSYMCLSKTAFEIGRLEKLLEVWGE